jgi:hypothetical protein
VWRNGIWNYYCHETETVMKGGRRSCEKTEEINKRRKEKNKEVRVSNLFLCFKP